MKSEKPWIFPKIALYFAIAFPFMYPFVSDYPSYLYFWFSTYKYGKEILNTDPAKAVSFNFVFVPLALSLIAIILCLLLKKPTADNKVASMAFIVSIFTIFITSVFLYPSTTISSDVRTGNCLYNMKQIGMAIEMYADDYDSKLPPIGYNWNSGLKKYKIGNKVLHCKNVVTSKDPTYAFNKNLVGFDTYKAKQADKVIMIFESTPGKNLFGTSELLPKYPRHYFGDSYGFLDGHVKSMRRGSNITMFQPKIAK